MATCAAVTLALVDASQFANDKELASAANIATGEGQQVDSAVIGETDDDADPLERVLQIDLKQAAAKAKGTHANLIDYAESFTTADSSLYSGRTYPNSALARTVSS